MQTIKINLENIKQEQIEMIVDYLKQGKVIAYPTDTIYGLGCDARNSEAVMKIREIKGRDDKKPMLILINGYEMLDQYCEVSGEQRKYLENACGTDKSPLPPLLGGVKKPTTVILKKKGNLPDELTCGLDSLAVRLPNNDFLIKIISMAGFPVVSTSLNKTGEPTLNNVNTIKDHFEILPDLAIDGGVITATKPSMLIDLRDVKNVKVIRE